MKINVLPLPISAASTVLNVRPPLAQGQLQEGAVLALLDSSGSPKSKRLVQKYTVCMHAVYSKSIALQGQISLQAASSHATCSLVPLRKSNLVFGFRSLSDF
jgi:hypothetical protein